MEEQTRNGASGRDRQAARKAKISLARALEDLSGKLVALEDKEASLRERREKEVAKAIAKAEEKMRKALEALNEERKAIQSSAIALDGVRDSEIADWFGLSVREVKEWRKQFKKEEPAPSSTQEEPQSPSWD